MAGSKKPRKPLQLSREERKARDAEKLRSLRLKMARCAEPLGVARYARLIKDMQG